eukprot:2889810-Pleurochrysis_carterae.AAC.1
MLPAGHADLIINTLLSFDGLLDLWFHVKEPIKFMAPENERVTRALGTCCKVYGNLLMPVSTISMLLPC